MNTKDEIKILMERAEISNRRLAEAVGISKDRLYYALNVSFNELDTDIYVAIMRYFEQHGYTKAGHRTETLLTKSLDLNKTIGDSLSGFNTRIKQALNDNRIDPMERKLLREHLTEMKKQLVSAITKTLEQL